MFCCPHCLYLSTISFIIVTPDLGSTAIVNIVDKYKQTEQYGQQNTVRAGFHHHCSKFFIFCCVIRQILYSFGCNACNFGCVQILKSFADHFPMITVRYIFNFKIFFCVNFKHCLRCSLFFCKINLKDAFCFSLGSS